MAKKIDYASLFTLRKDGRYQGWYKDENGKRKAVYDRNPEVLYKKLMEKESPAAITFAVAAESWEAIARETISERTWINYKPHFERLISVYGDMPIERVTGFEVTRELQSAKAKGYSRTVVNTTRTLFNNVLNHAVAKGWIPYNPATGIRLPKNLPQSKRSAPTDEQIAIICSNIDKPFGMFPFLLLCTGLRKAEALGLLKSDINLAEKEISVTKALTLVDGQHPKVKPPKSEAGTRIVPIPDVLAGPLSQYMAGLKSEYLFPAKPYNGHPGGGYMSQSNYDTAWANYCKEANLHDISAHNLRHGTATLLFESGADAYTAKAILGHAKVTTTMEIYTELRERQKKKGIDQFNEAVSTVLSKSIKT
jgi:integrase